MRQALLLELLGQLCSTFIVSTPQQDRTADEVVQCDVLNHQNSTRHQLTAEYTLLHVDAVQRLEVSVE